MKMQKKIFLRFSRGHKLHYIPKAYYTVKKSINLLIRGTLLTGLAQTHPSPPKSRFSFSLSKLNSFQIQGWLNLELNFE